jgi:DNA-directed RNA polymerase specialized sigma24 family protein
MTLDQFDALAALIHMRQSASRNAARLVLVDGLSVLDAARQCGISVQGANQAVLRCRRALEMARVAVLVR